MTRQKRLEKTGASLRLAPRSGLAPLQVLLVHCGVGGGRDVDGDVDDGRVGRALLLDALVRALQPVPAVAPDGADHAREGPHADAPRVAVVRADLRVPLEGLLAGDLPEVALRPPGERL